MDEQKDLRSQVQAQAEVELEKRMKVLRKLRAERKIQLIQLREDALKSQLDQLREDEARIRIALDALNAENLLSFGWEKMRVSRSHAPYPEGRIEAMVEVDRLRRVNSQHQKLVEARVLELMEDQKVLRDEAESLQNKLELCKAMFTNSEMGFGAFKIKQLPPLKKEIEQPKESEQNVKTLFDGWKEILESHKAMKEEMAKTIAEFKGQLSQLQQDSQFMQELRDKNEVLLQELRDQQGLLAVRDAFKKSLKRDEGVTNSYSTSNANRRLDFRYSKAIEKSASAAIAEQAREYNSKKQRQPLQSDSQEDVIDNLLDTNAELQTEMILLREKREEALLDEKFKSFVLGHKSQSARPSSSRSEIGASHFSGPESARPKSSQSASAAAPSATSRGNKSSPLDSAARYLKSTLFQPPR